MNSRSKDSLEDIRSQLCTELLICATKVSDLLLKAEKLDRSRLSKPEVSQLIAILSSVSDLRHHIVNESGKLCPQTKLPTLRIVK